jgi:dihydrofolate reductase
MIKNVGALVCGRRLFDITDGWGDEHPIGAPVVVVTHRAPANADRWPRTRFVGDVAQAVALAKEIAGGRDVAVASADIAGQALDLRLIDEVAVSLVPTLMGSGKAFFGTLTRGPIMLDDPAITPGTRATHLRYRVRR